MARRLHGFSELEVRSLSERVMEEIRQAVLDGRVRPGDRLVEADLASSFGVSRGCVREALRGLEHEGLVTSTPYRETRVAIVTEEEIVGALLPVRVVLELFAAHNLRTKADPQQIAALQRTVQRMHESFDSGQKRQQIQLDIEFHGQLMAAGGTPAIQSIWDGIDARIRGFLVLDNTASDMVRHAASHEALLSVILSGEPDEIDRAVVRHIYHRLPERALDSAPFLVANALKAAIGP